jgi:HAD superfamily hydrolase (TIGR01484 family)
MLIIACLPPGNIWPFKMVKVEAIFSDYDGTLSPLEVRREDAFISPRRRRLLTKAGRSVQIGIITTKDLSFIKERVPFADGIAATCGLEIQVGDKIIIDERIQLPNKKVEKAYQEVLAGILQMPDNVSVERKETENGDLVAFCIDWRLARDWPEAQRKTAPILASCTEQGLYVVESGISPFANVFPVEVSKGDAFVRLRKEMGVTGSVIYLGDSEADNPAFQIADISIGIKHRRTVPELLSKYVLEYFELDGFLSNLIDADFEFRDEMIERNTR